MQTLKIDFRRKKTAPTVPSFSKIAISRDCGRILVSLIPVVSPHINDMELVMTILKHDFPGLKVGQVWNRKNSRSEVSPHILILAVGAHLRSVTPHFKARIYDGDKNLPGSTTVYPYIENLESGYEYLGVLKPEPKVGAILTRLGGKGHLKVLQCSGTSCKVADWDRKRRMPLSASRPMNLDALFWDHVEIFFPKK